MLGCTIISAPMMTNHHHRHSARRSPASRLLLATLDFSNLLMSGKLRALQAEHLMEEALVRTGLGDFGDSAFVEPLKIWLDAINGEPRLCAPARIIAKRRANSSLRHRLLFQAAFSQNPTILARPIERPIIIASLPRTGTTLLHRMLAQDPRARGLLGWESMAPIHAAVIRAGLPDQRMRRVRSLGKAALRLAPALRAIHEFDPEQPDECGLLVRNSFVSPMDRILLDQYAAWYDQQPLQRISAAYREYREQLQFLQSERPVPDGGHWILKSPVHSYALSAIGEVFPDVTIVLIHRDPAKFVPSFCSLMGFFFDILLRREYRDMPELVSRSVDWCLEGLRRTEADRKRDASLRIVDIRYSDLVRDPVAVVRALYDRSGHVYDDEFDLRLHKWLAAHPKGKFGQHHHRPDQFGLHPVILEEKFGWYRERYQISFEN
jgi:hypothetical protein